MLKTIWNILVLRLVWRLFCLRYRVAGVRLGFRAQVKSWSGWEPSYPVDGKYTGDWALVTKAHGQDMLLTLLHEGWHAQQDRVGWPKTWKEVNPPRDHGRWADQDFYWWLDEYPVQERPSEWEAELWARHLAMTSFYWAWKLLR
jgi:hypothetical protein